MSQDLQCINQPLSPSAILQPHAFLLHSLPCRLRKIANSVRLEGKETEAQLLKANQDTILLRQRAMQESVKALADQMFELRSMITTIPGIVKKRREEDVAGIE